MTKTRNFGRAVLLMALMAGLSALGVLRHRHGHPLAHVAQSHHALPVHTGGTGRAPGRGSGSSNSRRSSSHGVSASDNHDVAPLHDLGAGSGPHVDFVAFVRSSLLHFGPAFVPSRFTRENTVAYGSAPRAPGLTRGPPALLS